MLSVYERIPGYADVVEYFSGWPSFHDWEVLEILLSRSGHSRLLITPTNLTTLVDGKDIEKLEAVSFTLEGIRDLSLSAFNHQNVLGALWIEELDGGLRIQLGDCFGVCGWLEIESIARVEVINRRPLGFPHAFPH
jgi:hypothetical protein